VDCIEGQDGFSVRVLRDGLTFLCVFSERFDDQKALKYLYDIKNRFAFKYCDGNTAKANKSKLESKKIEEFKEEMIKARHTHDTGINTTLVKKANDKIQEVAQLMHENVRKQLESQEGTEKLLADAEKINFLSRELEHNAEKLKPTCCHKFCCFSKPCILIVLILIGIVISYCVLSLVQCGDISLILGDC